MLLCLCFYIPLSSMAWGMIGHRIVGQIADNHLSVKARAEIRKILGNESIAMASNWADFVKADSTYDYLEIWHYANYEKGLSYEQLKEKLRIDTISNVYNRINFLVAELKKKSHPVAKKQFYLRLLIHFVGDLHQPLHVSPHGTSGGNDVKVQWFGASSNLHRVWDSQLIEHQQLSYSEYAAHIDHATATQQKTWQGQPLTLWVFESFSLASTLHEEIKSENPRLSYRYNYDHYELLNGQLLKGGIRLAGLLNQIFG